MFLPRAPGLCLLHILWPMPGVVTRGILGAIACPPDLLTMSPAKEEDSLHLVHYQSDACVDLNFWGWFLAGFGCVFLFVWGFGFVLFGFLLFLVSLTSEIF